MSPRERNHKHRDLSSIPNLYRKRDKRTGRDNYQYKDPRNGKFWGLGSDEEAAKTRAKQLNAAIYAQLAQLKATDNILADQPVVKSSGIAFSKWVDEYLTICEDRLNKGEIKSNTHRNRMAIAKKIAQLFGDKIGIKNITVKDIKQQLQTYRDQGKERMAQSLRSCLIDIFAEAIQAGEVDTNPAILTKNNLVRVKRSWLTFDEWKTIYEAASTLQPWVQNSMLLAVLTGQRLEDLALARFKKSADWEPALIAYRQRQQHPIKPYAYVEDGYFHVIQQKTGTLLRIPLSLRINCLDLSLSDVITRCRGDALSKYLIHHSKAGCKQQTGDPVHLNTVSKGFKKARNKTVLKWDGKTPPTFHEQRSLAERLYKEQGLDTQLLLGHKSSKMTDVYHDVRGAEWVDVVKK